MKVYIKENSILARIAAWKLNSKKAAIVFGNTIHLYNISRQQFLDNTRLMRHELCHVRQYQQHGFFPFVFKYLVESIRNGYTMNKFEVEARAAEETADGANPAGRFGGGPGSSSYTIET
jgi:hypothetical protein